MPSATPDYPTAVSRMGFARPPRDVLPRQVAQQARSWRSPDTRLSLRWSVTRALPDKNSWRGEQSTQSPKMKVANSN